MTLVDELRDRFGVEPVLRVIGVAVSTYYGWLTQAANTSPRRRDDADLAVEIARFTTCRVAPTAAAGARHAAPARPPGGSQAGRAVDARARSAGGVPAQEVRIPSTRSNPKATPAPDLVNRQFTAAAPNRLWVADATRIPCGQGVFWLAAVRDAFSNRIVGWRCSDRCDTDLILGALEYGIWFRDNRDGQLIHRSDRGGCIERLVGRRRLGHRPGDLPSEQPRIGDVRDTVVLLRAAREDKWSTGGPAIVP
ncbi:DDE-type integrase/transposase/recombinase [Micromonospora sp. WMMD558]|uniref:DDE-type integrase/transposase/recombinase n=1 Tax=Micromonospora sp. WMMD558 TaxID=3403462 RepID=UPI003BF58708